MRTAGSFETFPCCLDSNGGRIIALFRVWSCGVVEKKGCEREDKEMLARVRD